jgi:conjugative relaxase-like TrwC/TraI family protein
MMSVSAIKSSGSAGHYFEKDDYYVDGLSPSEWFGEGAHNLGLSGEVDRTTFKMLLDGQLPDGTRVGTFREGEWNHQPGVDLTFSAPKSVSVLAEVAGDQRLMLAHDFAVRSVLQHIEREYIVTRKRSRIEKSVEYEKTGIIVAATFKHTTSRALDPQLHTHSVVMNLTQRKDGEWRSIENKPIFIDQKHLGLMYRQFLAVEVQSLGYQLDHGKDGTWEIIGFDEKTIRDFSKRSEAIGDALEARGKTRDTATASEKETATLDTRNRKISAERGELLERWHTEIGSEHVGELRQLVMQSKENSPGIEMQSQALLKRVQVANEAVMWATEHLGERNTSWSHQELVKESSRYAGSRIILSDIENAIRAAAKEGVLHEKSVRIFDKTCRSEVDVPGYTSKTAIAVEDEMIKEEYVGRNKVRALCNKEEAFKAVIQSESKANSFGYEWNQDQRRAVQGILTSGNKIVGVQGLAGTAKTNSVLRTVAETAQNLGYEVRGLAPTNSAAQSLTEGAGIQSCTIQSFLAQTRNDWIQERKLHAQLERVDKRLSQISHILDNPGIDEKTGVLIPKSSPMYQQRVDELCYERTELTSEREELAKGLKKSPEIWIVDEASMVGTKLMRDLLQRAGQMGARVILNGDVRQLASVEAGAAFRQLQSQGMETYHLEEIVRQTNRGTRDAVYLSLMKKAATALNRLEQSGSVIKEMVSLHSSGKVDREKSGDERRAELVKDYMALSPETRASSIILEPSREGRSRTNELVREALRLEGSLGNEIKVSRLFSADPTEAERRIATTYQDGQIVRFERSLKKEGLNQNTYYQVAGRDGRQVLLRPLGSDKSQDLIRFSPERYSAKNVQVFNLIETGISVGEKIVWRDNNKASGRVNNDVAMVEKLNGTIATFRLSNGKTADFDMANLQNAHWDHGYAMTVHAAQGKTAQNVFVHAETNRASLLNTEQFYVQISRAKHGVYLYTDSKKALIEAVEQRTGQKQTAMESRFQPLSPLDHLMDKLWDKNISDTQTQEQQISQINRQAEYLR